MPNEIPNGMVTRNAALRNVNTIVRIAKIKATFISVLRNCMNEVFKQNLVGRSITLVKL